MRSARSVEEELSARLAPGLRLARRAGDEAYFLGVCARSGVIAPADPRRLGRMLRTLAHQGLLAGSVAVAAIRHPDRVAIRDERGDLTYAELDRGANALANAWRDRGLAPGEGVTILARNHRGFLYALFAAAKCGARIVLLNTSFAGPQICEVATREGTDLLVHDEEYSELLGGIDPPRGRWLSFTEDPAAARRSDTLEGLIATGAATVPPRSPVTPKIVILTSGTTGAPKGAPRPEPRSLAILGGLLSKAPFRAGETTELCAPMFHALGLAQMVLGMALGSTLVVRRHFDPQTTLDSLQDNRASAVVVVPVMLARILDLGSDAIAARDLSPLRIIFVSGSALGADLATRALAAFGPVVYNLYGSTEVASATIATPEDLRAEPGTVGRVVRGSVVKILDDAGDELPAGATGRIFVGNFSQFEGYTGGETKEQLHGLMSSGDVGHFDDHHRLFIDGRDDEMIVSGGENVFPAEVEELLGGHEAIREVAVLGVADERFGQRLAAFVVVHEGRELSAEEVKLHVRDNLARYKVPREVVFLAELPRNPTGKVLKRELRLPEPDGAQPTTAAPGVRERA